jgi:hypothetical protein
MFPPEGSGIAISVIVDDGADDRADDGADERVQLAVGDAGGASADAVEDAETGRIVVDTAELLETALDMAEAVFGREDATCAVVVAELRAVVLTTGRAEVLLLGVLCPPPLGHWNPGITPPLAPVGAGDALDAVTDTVSVGMTTSVSTA